jgi:hypothetical protein
MPKQTHVPEPAKATTESFDDRCKEVARRNDEAYQKAIKVRAQRTREQIRAKRQLDLL